ncbi:Swi3-domain-containing protein [Pholiota conissans]|uniref:Chromosome segregation in meiosis protein n=1 Tax=Pholiota conissans TaxID=109636 RepID=A0A9P6D573_9AGAR|nr:Swi3-domain-containing protein [Pholiota conissans]
MDSSLDSIWDDPAFQNSPKRALAADDQDEILPRSSKRPRSSLFYSDSDESAGPSNITAPPPPELDMDALFAEFDDDDLSLQPLPARIDEEAAIRQAEARYRNKLALTPHQILPSSSPSRDVDKRTGTKSVNRNDKGDDEKKTRRKFFKLDENRLMSPNGFPELIKMTRDFKIKGKGHEATDLNRILQTYQYWTHRLYPKTQFHDTVERIEKLCHSRRMNVALSVWRDEAHGITNRRKTMEDESDHNEVNDNVGRDIQMDTDDHQPRPQSASSMPSSRASSPPATSAAESEVLLQPRVAALIAPSQHGEEEEEAFWRSLDEVGSHTSGAHAPAAASAAVPQLSMDDDEEMWDIINEVEQSAAKPSNLSPPSLAASAGVDTDPADDWDDMYL